MIRVAVSVGPDDPGFFQGGGLTLFQRIDIEIADQIVEQAREQLIDYTCVQPHGGHPRWLSGSVGFYGPGG